MLREIITPQLAQHEVTAEIFKVVMRTVLGGSSYVYKVIAMRAQPSWGKGEKTKDSNFMVIGDYCV